MSTLPITPNAAPSARVVPSWAAFFSRSSSGSISRRSASSSTTDSTAYSAAGAPGARYAPTFGLLTTTSQPSTEMFSASYGAKAHIAPAVNGEPG